VILIDVDVVVPVFNEAGNLQPLYEEIKAGRSELDRKGRTIFVDDGSEDDSWPIIRELAKTHESVTGLRLGANRGQSTAFFAGFRESDSPLVATIDADGQNDPADLADMLEQIADADVVAGYRKNRQDSAWKRFGSTVANTVRNWVTGDDVIDTGCSLKLFRRPVVDSLPRFEGMHRFLPTLARMNGFTVKQVPVNHRPRRSGETSYSNLGRLTTTILDLLAVRWMQSRTVNAEVSDRSD
jgi:dolichol-phosphate mannosyltransferase